jgi:iron complex transport system ATP-binding protein
MKLEAHALSFGYRGYPVGRDVSMAFAAGEIVCLLGPNGGGKTTLFRTLLGLLAPQGGRVVLGGEDVWRLPRKEIAKRVSYVPQAHAGYFPFSVRDVVLMGRTAHLAPFGAPGRHDRERTEAAIAELGLAALADKPYTRISGGERQLALIARALAQDAPLVVMDEPTASLDFGNQVKVLDRVRALASRGIGILMATHDPDQAFLCAHRVALLHDGRLIADGPPETVVTRATLRQVYGVDVSVAEVEAAGVGRRRVCLPTLDARR